MDRQGRLLFLQRQIDRFGQRLASLEKLSNRYSWARLLVFSAAVIVAGLVFFLGDVRLFWAPLVLGLLVFGILVQIHSRVDESIGRHRLWLQIKRGHIARARLDWSSLPPCPYRPERALELDLDLVGEFSLFRLANTAVTEGGAERLRGWLANPAPILHETHRRQAIARELAGLPLFRDKLTLNGAISADGASPDGGPTTNRQSPARLLTWLEEHQLPPAIKRWLVLLSILAALNLLLFLLDLIGLIPPWWQLTLALYAILLLVRSGHIGETFSQAAELRDILAPLVAVFSQLERYSYRKTPRLQELCRPFLESERRPSHFLRRVNRVVNATGVRGNPIFWALLNLPLPWDYIFAWQLERCRIELTGRLPLWLDAWYELEALSSLANLAYLNPGYTFPEIAGREEGEAGEPALFEAKELGHPLIRHEEKVCNDFGVGTLGAINLITGSNMSGKSTFLRTVGINLILAYAGGPVNAQNLKTAVFRLHTCIRISDSVTDGVSYFYAEVKCLKALLSELKQIDQRPLFYLIDEIFRGTNNRERLIGSQAYIGSLVGEQGLGLISTHDLELVNLAEKEPRIRNLHFSDDVAGGRMSFEYKLRPGPSPTTNALRIMRLEGLPV